MADYEGRGPVIPVLAIDGPSGVGKGSVGQEIAQRKSWHFLDSGAVYRVLGFAALQNRIAVDDIDALVELAADLPVAFQTRPGDTAQVILDGKDVGEVIRNEDCASLASKIAALSPVRMALIDLQRRFCKPPGLVADGRDMGTVVFPHAKTKVYLTACAEIRAERRYRQLIGKGWSGTLPPLIEAIRDRDRQDATRKVSPLRPAPDAHIVDTSALTIEEVVNRVLELMSA